MTPEGWRNATYGMVLVELEDRAGTAPDLPVLSVTKTRGPMLASERFGKVMHGRDLAKYRIAPRNTIVADPMLLWDGSIGLQTVVDSGLVSPDYRVYRPVDGVDPTFIGYVVRSPHMLPHYQGGARGTNVRRNRIARADFLALPLKLPPLAEQLRISAILSSLDAAVEATQAVVDHLTAVRKAMMVELLARGLPGQHTRVRHTAVGELPEAWALLRLDEAAVVQTGIAKGKTCDQGIELPYLRVANVQDGFLDLGEVKTIVVEPNSVQRYSLRAGDVLFTEGGDADKLGRGCVWRGEVQPCLHQNHVFAVRCQDDRLRPDFLAYWAASPRGKAYFLDCAKQTTNLASINSSQLRAFPVPLPSLEEQDAILAPLLALDHRIQAERAYAAQLSVTRTSLISVLLTGEVRIPGHGNTHAAFGQTPARLELGPDSQLGSSM